MAHVHQMVAGRGPRARCSDPSISERFGVRESLLDGYTDNSSECVAMALREINSDAHADARVRTGRAAGPNRVRNFALWTGHGARGNSGALRITDSITRISAHKP